MMESALASSSASSFSIQQRVTNHFFLDYGDFKQLPTSAIQLRKQSTLRTAGLTTED